MKLTPRAISRIEAIRKKTGATSDAEVVRRALRLYERIINKQEVSDT